MTNRWEPWSEKLRWNSMGSHNERSSISLELLDRTTGKSWRRVTSCSLWGANASMPDIARILIRLGFPYPNASNIDARRQRPEPERKQRTQRRLKTKCKAWSRKWVSKNTYGESYEAVNNTSPCWPGECPPLCQASSAADSISWLAFLTISFGISSATRPQFADFCRVNLFAARLGLIICGLHQDQLMQVLFRATFPTWYKKWEIQFTKTKIHQIE